MSIISIQNLTKVYKNGTTALGGISLDVAAGEFLGLLGPNGAGKSTTISILSSLTTKTSGTVTICGHNIDTEFEIAKTAMGIVPQDFNFSIFEPCLQILLQQAGYYGLSTRSVTERAISLLEKLELSDKIYTPAGQLSGGQKRRLMIARALIHSPQILILDEPTAGVDISMRRAMWDLFTELNRSGITIILTTHNLDEAESLCKRIAIIDHGHIIKDQPTTQLLDHLHSEILVLYVDETPTMPPIDGLHFQEIEPGVYEVEITQQWTVTALIQELAKSHISVNRIRNKANRLEALFVKLVSK